MNQGKMSPGVGREALPDHRDLALFVATLFQRLGGTLEIDTAGRRHARRPRRLGDHHRDLPQLAEAQPWERFHSRAEWEGAMKLAEYWLGRLSAADREYVFTLLAEPVTDPAGAFDFRERL